MLQSMKRSTSSSGSGYFSSVSKPLYLPHLLFKKQRKPLRKLLLPFLSTFFPPLNRKKVKRNLITEHDTSAFPKWKMNDLVSFFFPRSSEFLSPCVSSGDHLQSVYPSVRTTTSVPSRQAGMYRNGHRKILCRRLVPHLFDGTKHRLRHFQSKFLKKWLPRHYSLYIDTIDHKIKEIHPPKDLRKLPSPRFEY